MVIYEPRKFRKVSMRKIMRLIKYSNSESDGLWGEDREDHFINGGKLKLAWCCVEGRFSLNEKLRLWNAGVLPLQPQLRHINSLRAGHCPRSQDSRIANAQLRHSRKQPSNELLQPYVICAWRFYGIAK